MNRFAAALAACASLALLPGVLHAQNITSCAAGQVCMSIDGASGGGARVPLNTTPGRAAIAINPTDGSVTVRSVSEAVLQCTQTSTAPIITSFTATPSSVTPGTQVTLSWSTTNVSTSGTPCQAISGPSEWTAIGLLPSSGSRVVQANGVAPSTLTYGLRCTGTDTTQVTQTVSVSLASNPTNCSGQNAPPEGYQLTVLPLCGTFPCASGTFPPGSTNRGIQLSQAVSIAYQFTPTLSFGGAQLGSVTTDEWLGQNVTPGNGTISISACPHDYGNNLGLCRDGPGAALAVTYTIGPPATNCPLVSGSVYYFNITSGNSTTIGGSNLGFCTTYPCRALTVWRGFEQPKSRRAGAAK